MNIPIAFALSIVACCTVGFVSACNPAQSSEISEEPASEWPKLYRPGTDELYGEPPIKPGPEFIWSEGKPHRSQRDYVARFFMSWDGTVYPISGELFEAYVRRDGYAPKGAERSAAVERVEEPRGVMGVIR